jgi:hypothetical protein
VNQEKLNHDAQQLSESGSCLLSHINPSFFRMDAILSFPPSPDFKSAWTIVMSDLLQATHCHGCGAVFNVALLGYCGQYCSKHCWRDEMDAGEDFACAFGDDCVCCAGGFVSLANSWRHKRGVAPLN